MSDKSDKIYFKISEVSDRLGETYATLRLWEKEFGLNLHTVRGTRYYKESDIATLEKIQHLRRVEGYTIDGAKAKIADGNQDIARKRDIAQRLTAIRSELVAIRRELNTQAFAQSVIID